MLVRKRNQVFIKGKMVFVFIGLGVCTTQHLTLILMRKDFCLSGKLRDTLYFKLWVMGNISTHDRRLVLKQSVLSSTDSSSYANKNVAVAGVNYVAFDDPEMEKFLIIPPDSSYVYIPVIMTYDPTIAGTRQDFRLHFEIVPTDEFSRLWIEILRQR